MTSRSRLWPACEQAESSWSPGSFPVCSPDWRVCSPGLCRPPSIHSSASHCCYRSSPPSWSAASATSTERSPGVLHSGSQWSCPPGPRSPVESTPRTSPSSPSLLSFSCCCCARRACSEGRASFEHDRELRVLVVRRHRRRDLHAVCTRRAGAVRICRAPQLRSRRFHGHRRLHDGDPRREGGREHVGGSRLWCVARDARRRSAGLAHLASSSGLLRDHDDRLQRDPALRRHERGSADGRLTGDDQPGRDRQNCAVRRPVALLAVTAVWLMMRTPWGRVLKSIREDEDAAASLGKNVFAYKLQALVVGAALGALAGVFYAWQFRFFSPDDFAPLLTFFAWMIVILGGLGRAWTVPIGAIVFGVIFAGTRFFDFVPFSLLDSTERAYVRLIVIGLVIIGLMLFRPQGIFGSRKEMVLE